MPATITSQAGGWAVSLLSSSLPARQIGRSAASEGGPPAKGRKPKAPVAAPTPAHAVAHALAAGTPETYVQFHPVGAAMADKIAAQATAAGRKYTAHIHLRSPARRELVAARSAATPVAAPLDDRPALRAKLAREVADRVRGLASIKADEYLRELAAWQLRRADAELTQLAGALMRGMDGTDDSNTAAVDVRQIADDATQAWLLSDYLNNDGNLPATEALDRTIDRVLHRMDSEALLSLHEGIVVAGGGHAPHHTAEIPRFFLGMVGLPAARNAWAASTICDLVGQPLSFDQLCVLLRTTAARDPNAISDNTAVEEVAARLDALTTGHYQPVLMQHLRIRAQAALQERGIPVNELVGIARQDLPDDVYAGEVADALRGALASESTRSEDALAGPHLTDVQIRQRLDAALDALTDAQIQAAAANLLTGAAATKEHTLHLKGLVARRGAGPAEQAVFGRQFTILCEALVDRIRHEPKLPALEALHAWDWDARLSRCDPPAFLAGRVARVGDAVYRGLRRLVVSLVDPDKAAAHRAGEARADLSRAASAFMEAAGRATARDGADDIRAVRRHLRMGRLHSRLAESSTPAPDPALRAFNQSGFRLWKAGERYEAACKALGEDRCKALGLATNSVQYYEAAFSDALSRMPGGRVDGLGRTLFQEDRVDGLLERQQLYRGVRQAAAPRAPSLLKRLFNARVFAREQSAGLSQFQYLLHRMRSALKEEPAIRAAAEVVRTLDRYVVQSVAAPGAAAGPGAVAVPGAVAGEEIGPAGGMSGQADAGSAGASTEEGRRKSELLSDIWTLDQRFRPLERRHGFVMDWSREHFVRVGMQRLTSAERGRLRDAVCDLDRRPPAWLANDELWLAVVRGYQGERTSRADA